MSELFTTPPRLAKCLLELRPAQVKNVVVGSFISNFTQEELLEMKVAIDMQLNFLENTHGSRED